MHSALKLPTRKERVTIIISYTYTCKSNFIFYEESNWASVYGHFISNPEGKTTILHSRIHPSRLILHYQEETKSISYADRSMLTLASRIFYIMRVNVKAKPPYPQTFFSSLKSSFFKFKFLNVTDFGSWTHFGLFLFPKQRSCSNRLHINRVHDR